VLGFPDRPLDRPAVGIRFLLVAVLCVGLLGLAAGCGGGEPAATEPVAEPVTLSVYFLRGEKIGVAHRHVPARETVETAAIEELLGGPRPDEEDAGLHTEIPAGTELNGLEIAAGVATVDLSSEFDDGGGSLTMFGRLAQVVFTLTQFPGVQGVLLELEGEPVDVFSSEGIGLDGPQARDDYEHVAPAILVETPAVGDTVSSPMRLTGTANTFEATFNYDLLGGGRMLATGFVTATCGTGCRGTFDETIPFEWRGEPRGALVVYELSAEDGSRINIYEIPLAFE
jgi:hypothetical protein